MGKASLPLSQARASGPRHQALAVQGYRRVSRAKATFLQKTTVHHGQDRVCGIVHVGLTHTWSSSVGAAIHETWEGRG